MKHEMFGKPFPPMKVTIPGLTSAELARGLQAAIVVFEVAGIDPWTAAEGAHRREWYDITGFKKRYAISREEGVAAAVWDEADAAAYRAACADRPEKLERPSTGHLMIVTKPEIQLLSREPSIAMLRAFTARDKKNVPYDDVGYLAWNILANVENRFTARDLASDLTTSFASWVFDLRDDESLCLQRIVKAIDAAEQATA